MKKAKKRPRLMRIFLGDYCAHGPPCQLGNLEFSYTYDGSKTWAVDEDGIAYNLAHDMRDQAHPRSRVWVPVPEVVDPPAWRDFAVANRPWEEK